MSIKKVITTKTEDGKTLNLNIKTPTANELQRAQMEANKVFRLGLESKALLRSRLTEYLIEQGLWNEDMQVKLEGIASKIYEKEKILMAGGIKRSDAKKICMEIRDLRVDQARLLVNQRQHDLYTAEAQAENAKFDFLVSVCTLDEEGKPYFTNVDDYKSRATEQAAADAASAVAEVVNQYDPDWEKKLPENKFLLQHGFVNEELQFVDKDGKLVDVDGRRVDVNGRYINEKGEFINRDGVRVDDDGNPIIEFKPLLDDDEVTEDKKEVTEVAVTNPA